MFLLILVGRMLVKTPCSIPEYLDSILTSGPDSNFLPMRTLGSSGDCSSNQLPAIHILKTYLNSLGPSFSLAYPYVLNGIWGANQQMGILSVAALLLSLCLSNKDIFLKKSKNLTQNTVFQL